MPNWLPSLRPRLAPLKLSPAREAEIIDELSAHLDDRWRELVSGGASADAATRTALEDLASPGALAERLRAVESRASTAPPLGNTEGHGLSAIAQDVRYALRALRSEPGFAAVALITLALGIGANMAIFQLLNAVTLRTLPVRDPQALVEIRVPKMKGATGNFTGRRPTLTYSLWQQIQQHLQDFSGVFAWGTAQFNLSTGGESRYAQGLWVSGSFFDVLGVSPQAGRLLGPADDVRGCGAPGVVLSDAFWHREYGADPHIVGRTISLSGHTFQVAGVTPPSFFGVEVGWRFDVAAPICAQPIVEGSTDWIDRSYFWWLAAMGRLKPGVTVERASANLVGASAQIFKDTLPERYQPEDAKNYLAYRLNAIDRSTGVSTLRSDYQTPLWMLLAMTGLVLIIACANLANLLIARASARQREIAIRLALGASRARLVRQLLVEGLLLSLAGAAVGVGVGALISRGLVAFLDTDGRPVFLDLTTDWRIVGASVGLAVLTCLAFGLAPALRATAVAPAVTLNAQGRGQAGSRERSGLRRALVAAQVALSFVLLVGALLFVRTFRNLVTLDAGFAQDGILVAELDLRPLHAEAARLPALHRDVIDKLRAIPAVAGVAEADGIQATGSLWNERVKVGADAEPRGLTNVNGVAPGFLKTMGTRLLAGRDFTDEDAHSKRKVAIVSETFVKTIMKGAPAIGETLRFEMPPGEKETPLEIVGVMQDMKYQTLREDYTPIVYLDAQQEEVGPYIGAFIRSDASLVSLTSAVTRAVADVNPLIAVTYRPLKRELLKSLLLERLMATLSAAFGIAGGLLAVVGLYGVMAYAVARRRNEIGIRMALGATRGRVVLLIVREGGWLLAIGLTVGLGLALFAARSAGTLLFGLTPHDAATFIASAAVLAVVALAASYWPARRAARLDPLTALRNE